MEIIEFKDYPNTETPLSAYNLNRMQNNIKDEVNTQINNIEQEGIIVSPTEPTTNRRKVWLQKGKNLIDKNSANMKNSGFLPETGEVVAGNNKRLTTDNFIRLKKGTYTLSFINANRVWILAYDLQKNYKGDNYIQNAWEITNSKTFILNEECLIKFSISKTDDTEMSLNEEYNIQIEQGSTATEYEEYIETKMYVLNDNNVYEEFIKKINSSKIVHNGELLSETIENRMKRIYGATTWVASPIQTINTHININGGSGGKSLLLCISGHTSTGNSTYAAIYLIRCGHDGNNWDKTPIIEDKGGSKNIPIVFSVNSTGEFCYRVEGAAAKISIYELT